MCSMLILVHNCFCFYQLLRVLRKFKFMKRILILSTVLKAGVMLDVIPKRESTERYKFRI